MKQDFEKTTNILVSFTLARCMLIRSIRPTWAAGLINSCKKDRRTEANDISIGI